jgi:hypothetical protein
MPSDEKEEHHPDDLAILFKSFFLQRVKKNAALILCQTPQKDGAFLAQSTNSCGTNRCSWHWRKETSFWKDRNPGNTPLGSLSTMELRDQVTALLRMEVKYETRDYLLDLTSQNELFYSTTSESGNSEDSDYCSASKEMISASTNDSLDSAKAETKSGDEEKPMTDESVPSRAATTCSSRTAITEQHAVAWREKICEWSYQGKQKV